MVERIDAGLVPKPIFTYRIPDTSTDPAASFPWAVSMVVGGFFPECQLNDKPQRQRSSGFQEIGLPFESDVGITRHLASFLTMHADEADGAVLPTQVLFNGGVFKADMLRSLMLDLIGKWSQDGSGPKELPGQRDLDFAVARGAACCGAEGCGAVGCIAPSASSGSRVDGGSAMAVKDDSWGRAVTRSATRSPAPSGRCGNRSRTRRRGSRCRSRSPARCPAAPCPSGTRGRTRRSGGRGPAR